MDAVVVTDGVATDVVVVFVVAGVAVVVLSAVVLSGARSASRDALGVSPRAASAAAAAAPAAAAPTAAVPVDTLDSAAAPEPVATDSEDAELVTRRTEPLDDVRRVDAAVAGVDVDAPETLQGVAEDPTDQPSRYGLILLWAVVFFLSLMFLACGPLSERQESV